MKQLCGRYGRQPGRLEIDFACPVPFLDGPGKHCPKALLGFPHEVSAELIVFVRDFAAVGGLADDLVKAAQPRDESSLPPRSMNVPH